MAWRPRTTLRAPGRAGMGATRLGDHFQRQGIGLRLGHIDGASIWRACDGALPAGQPVPPSVWFEMAGVWRQRCQVSPARALLVARAARGRVACLICRNTGVSAGLSRVADLAASASSACGQGDRRRHCQRASKNGESYRPQQRLH